MCFPRNLSKNKNGDEDFSNEYNDPNAAIEEDEDEYEYESWMESEDESDYEFYDDWEGVESDGDVKSEYGDEVENECINAKILYIGTMIDLANDDYFTLNLDCPKSFYPTQSNELGFIMYKDEVVSNETLAERLREVKGKYENVFYPRHYNCTGVGSWYNARDSKEDVTKELKKYLKKIDYKSNNSHSYPFCLNDLFITTSLVVLFQDYTIKKTRRVNYLYIDSICVAVVCKRKKSETIGTIFSEQTSYVVTLNNDILYTDIFKLDNTMGDDAYEEFIGPVRRSQA